MADDSGEAQTLPVDPTLLKLPTGLAGTFDPVDENPFPTGTVRHRLWQEATREAEAKVTRLRADWAALRQATEAPKSFDEMLQWNADYHKGSRQLFWTEFQVWAGRGVQVIFSDGDVRLFDEWLVSYGDACLRDHAHHMLKHGLPNHLAERELRWMRDSLSTLVLHWKAEARRLRAEREQQRQSHSDQIPAAKAESTSGSGRRRTSRLLRRAAWLHECLDARKWTPADLERQGGPHVKTTRKILDGGEVREAVLEKLVLGLSTKGRVVRKEIPPD